MTSLCLVLSLSWMGDGRFQDGDRVVLVGDTLIEREQQFSFFEKELAWRNFKRGIVVRNLGWSADTPAGISRAYFDPPATGYQRLLEQIEFCQPTVVVLGYGTADALSGTPAESFRASMETLIGASVKPGRRLIVLAPVPPVEMSAVQVDGFADRLKEYANVLKELADAREGVFVDPTSRPWVKEDFEPNRLHLSQQGYQKLGRLLAYRLYPAGSELLIKVKVSPGELPQATIQGYKPVSSERSRLVLSASGLPPGNYELVIEGEATGLSASADSWKMGVLLASNPWQAQWDEIRRLAIRKNELFFQRYRPQNITYLLGFRSYEQGQNAREIEELDPKIEELERQIRERSNLAPIACEWKVVGR